MSKVKILVKITGSIAAYKSAYLISKLMQDDFDVEVVATRSALQFIGIATIEGLTHKPVHTDMFEPGKMMSHIDLSKWADIIIVVPADANTINKFAHGIADNLVTSLFLAHDRDKPYLIAPAMNTAMFLHPATQESLKKLSDWGIQILPTDEGYLACGDTGDGKLLDPDIIYGHIGYHLNKSSNGNSKVLITGGGTAEKIDSIREITNMSSGRTAVKIAEYFYINGVDVTLLLSEAAVKPKYNINTISFNSFQSLKTILKSELNSEPYDFVIHAAAVSDYSPTRIEVNNDESNLPLKVKLESLTDNVKIILSKNLKLVNEIKSWSKNKDVQLVAFKLLGDENSMKKKKELNKLFSNSHADSIVFNTLSNRKNDIQKSFELIDKDGLISNSAAAEDLAKELYNQWRSSWS